MSIEAVNITKRFGDFSALTGVNLLVPSGELVALLGPSGSGKTTLLRIIAGLDWPDEGEVRFDGEDALARSVAERHVGFVFQHYALFRHMTVFDNVAFGLRVQPRRRRLGETEIAKRVNALFDLVQIGWLAGRYPNQLSGGQRQRVALARALAIEPKVLLLDEPFGALDAKVRKELRRWLRALHSQIHVTSVFVTHDQQEAMEVADRIVVMDRGRIEQVGSPNDVYEHPATAFVYDFMGESNMIEVEVRDGVVQLDGRPVMIDSQGLGNGPAQFYCRPHDVTVVAAEAGIVDGVVRQVRQLGPLQRVEIAIGRARGETIIEADTSRAQDLGPGQRVGLHPRNFRLFPRGS